MNAHFQKMISNIGNHDIIIKNNLTEKYISQKFKIPNFKEE